ncbi:MAG: hypothetical protein K9W43_13535 [Candidatus Thorarchaeota archaeon]|nr:hypothetical protein [Candidatus Thorarchaeota archaeon]
MSNVWVRAWRNTPQYNCGLCGRSTCTAFARAYLAGNLDLDACPVMQTGEFVNLRTTLETMRTREHVVSPQPAPERSSVKIAFLQPCKDDIKRVSGTLTIYNGVPQGQLMNFGGFDPLVLCDLLDHLGDKFSFIKCSRELGYARADRDEINITILQDGRVNLRQVPDKGAIYKLAASLERVLIGALICDCCGCDLLSVLVDCPTAAGEHYVLDAGQMTSLDKEIISEPFSLAVLSATCKDRGPEVIAVFEHAFQKLERRLHEAIQGKWPSLKDEFTSSYQILLNHLMEVNDSKSTTLILKSLGVLRVIENALTGLANLGYESQIHNDEIQQIQLLLQSLATDTVVDLKESSVQPTTMANLARVQRATQLMNLWNTD